MSSQLVNGSPLRQSTKTQIPILLGNADYFGTLAAVRSLGKAGISVSCMQPSIFSLANWSRYSSHNLKCPEFEHAEKWVKWLIQMRRSIPYSALYATSDAVLFAIALYHDELNGSFAFYQPGLETILKILDKTKLFESAREAGVDVPETWLPKTAREAGRIVREFGGAFLIKPRSQLSQRTLTKGTLVGGSEQQVMTMFNRYIDDAAHGSAFAKTDPEILVPCLQRFYPEAMDRVYSLTGFRDKCGKMVLRGAHKILQMPRQIGVGLCFEDAPVYPDLARSASRLCERIGYFGVFELEYIFTGKRRMLIDFNGRFFNQMGLDVARGMNLPVMAYVATWATPEQLSETMKAVATEGRSEMVFCNQLELKLTINMHRIFRNISREEASRRRSWISQMGPKIIDAVYDGRDPAPTVVAIAQNLLNACRHPRAFVRRYGSVK